ncbi:hypothetical protein NPIL_660661, partial [Nephila pilipes]
TLSRSHNTLPLLIGKNLDLHTEAPDPVPYTIVSFRTRISRTHAHSGPHIESQMDGP